MNYKYIYTESIDGLGSELFNVTQSIKDSTSHKLCDKVEDTDTYVSYYALLHYLILRDKIDSNLNSLFDILMHMGIKGKTNTSQYVFKKNIEALRKVFANRPDYYTIRDYYFCLLRLKSVTSFTNIRELTLWLICGLHIMNNKGDLLNAVSTLIAEYDTVFGRLFIDIACSIFDVSFDDIKGLCKELPCANYALCDAMFNLKSGSLKKVVAINLIAYNASQSSSVVSCDEKPKRHCKVSYKKVRPKNTSDTAKSPSSNSSDTAKSPSSNSSDTAKSSSSNTSDTVDDLINLEPLMNNIKNIVNRSINFANSFIGNHNSCVIGDNVTMTTDSNGTVINSKIRIPAGHNVSVTNNKVYVDGKLYADLNEDDTDISFSNTKKYELTDNTSSYKGIVLHQIRALRSFGNVKTGELGGFIESEDNLSHIGTCWVYNSAKVYGKIKLMGTSIVSDEAIVTGNATIRVCIITDNSMFNASGNIRGKLIMSDDSYLSGNINLVGQLTMADSSSIRGSIDCSGQIIMADSSSIKDTLKCSGQLSMSDDSSMNGNSCIYGSVSMCDDSTISNTIVYGVVDLCDNAQVSNSNLYSMFHLDGHRTLNNYKG